MITISLPAASEDIDRAREAVSEGALLVVPTDTVYGIGANPQDQKAVDRLLTAKGRGREMPPPVLVPNLDEACRLAAAMPDSARLLMEKFWPGALTIVVEASSEVAFDLEEIGGTIALRQPSGPVLQVLEALGPLAVTSANLHAQPPAQNCAEAKAYFGEAVAVYFDGGQAPGGVASTIVKITVDGYQILREGALSETEIAKVLS